MGNVRSCRLYYVYFAKEFQAVYFHAGESKYALDVLNSSFIDNVDGITGKGGAFYYRDNSRRAPHNLYTTGENLASAMKTYGYDTKLPENYTSHYRFAAEDSPNLLEQGETAKKVSLYYVDAKPWFVYNETDGLYYRYEFGDKQIDGSTGEQLAVKNIILQNCYSSLKDSKKRNVRYRLSFRWIRNVHHKRKSCPDYMEKEHPQMILHIIIHRMVRKLL